MIQPFAIRITIELGKHRRDVSLSELAAALGVVEVDSALRRLVLGPMQPEGVHKEEGTTGEEERSHCLETVQREYSNPFPLGGPRGVRGDQGDVPSTARLELAIELADRLDDWKSARFFRLVVDRLPESTVRAALDRALDVPRRDVRRSRGAVFAALVRPHLAAARAR